MSEENVQLMRGATDAFNRRDRDAWLALNDPDIRFCAVAEWPESGTVRGAAAVWDFMVSLDEPWEDGAYEIDEVVEAGDDRLAARFKRSVQGTASGIAGEFDYWCVSTFRAGKVLSNAWFSNRAEAVEAAGRAE